jgi:hypothetical protein
MARLRITETGFQIYIALSKTPYRNSSRTHNRQIQADEYNKFQFHFRNLLKVK